MSNMATRRHLTWKTGPIFIVLCLIVGLALGFVIDEATSAPPSPDRVTHARPLCNSELRCNTSKVRTAKQGKRKFKAGKLGRAPVKVHYPKRFKKVVARKLARKLNKRMHGKLHRASGWTPNSAWRWYLNSNSDTCIPIAKNRGQERVVALTSCEGQRALKNYTAETEWKAKHVRIAFCAGMATIGVGGALATGAGSGPGAPWVWTGIGVGAAGCLFQDMLEKMADD